MQIQGKHIYSTLLSFGIVVNAFSQQVSTFAGTGTAGSSNETAATFNQPSSVVFDASGNLFVADAANHLIRKITPSGTVSTFAGTGTIGGSNGTGTEASFTAPRSITIDKNGNLFVSEPNGHRIRKITKEGVVSTFAGTGTQGNVDGIGTSASFGGPYGMIFDKDGNLYVTESLNHQIRKITPDGTVSVFAGQGKSGNSNGLGSSASFYSPVGIVVGSDGNFYVTEILNNKIRKITPNGEVSDFAGTGDKGLKNGVGNQAQFNSPYGITVDISGNLFVAELSNHTIRKITPNGDVSTYAGKGSSGNIDGEASTSSFNGPRGLVFDNAGNLFVADVLNHKIRKIGDITTSLNPFNYVPDEIGVFPNPASDVLYVKNAENIARYRLINNLGVEIQNGALKNDFISIKTLEKGTYFIHLVSKDNVEKSLSFIKY